MQYPEIPHPTSPGHESQKGMCLKCELLLLVLYTPCAEHSAMGTLSQNRSSHAPSAVSTAGHALFTGEETQTPRGQGKISI